jgi:peptidoglycan/LPS O-acetylase OafA/YrhL
MTAHRAEPARPQPPAVRTGDRTAGRGRTGTLTTRFDPRNNSVNALRLGLAGLVLFSHTIKLQSGEDPLANLTGGDVDLGTLAVDGFFALSGFLIVRSYLASPSVWRYLWRRCLRILPGFWVCLLVTAFVLLPLAQLIQFGTLARFPLTGDLSATSYVYDNALLLIRQFEVRGLLDGEVVNGSLHTLFYEFMCYLGVAVLGVVGVLRRRRSVVLVLAGLLWGVAAFEVVTNGALTADHVGRQLFLRFGLMFLAGAVAQLWAHRLILGRVGGVAAAALLALGLAGAALVGQEPRSTLVYLLVAPPAVAYLVLLIGASPRAARIGSRRDLSYGLYVYAWPVQVLLLLVGAALWPLPVYLAASLALALGLAWLSWTFVEAPALALKSWTPAWRRRAEPPAKVS